MKLIRHFQRPPIGVFRPGDYLVPNRRRDHLGPPLASVLVTSRSDAGDTERGFDTDPVAFGSIDPAAIAGLTVTESTVSDTGLVVLEFAGGARLPDDDNFGGLRVSVLAGDPPWNPVPYGWVAMHWSAANSRYESDELHPELFAMLSSSLREEDAA